MAAFGRGLTDPVTGRQADVSVQQEIGGNRVNSYLESCRGSTPSLIARCCAVGREPDPPTCPVRSRQNQDALTLQGSIDVRSILVTRPTPSAPSDDGKAGRTP